MRNVTHLEHRRHSRRRETAVEHVAIAPSMGRPVGSWPAECVVRPAEGGGTDDPAFVVFYMDDAISVEVQWDKGGGLCIVLPRSSASINFQAMGERSEGEESLLSYSKVTGWATQKEVLGYDICLLYTSPSPRDLSTSRMPSSA